MQRHAVFLLNLLQDVNVLRPLILMAGQDFGLPTEILIDPKFLARDSTGAWTRELGEIAAAADAQVLGYRTPFAALAALQGKGGIIFAGSESSLTAHAPTHRIFRAAPPSFLKVTLQHGFECVGFLQSRDHDIAHGRGVTFAADVVCGWAEADRLTSLARSQRPKLYVSGSPARLQVPPRVDVPDKERAGLVCENLHSARLNTAGDFKADFIGSFEAFCRAQAEEGRRVALRPHPGGQYVLRNGIELPANVSINNEPIYKVDLSQFAYGISAPSSVLIDMVLAGIPTAVWQDRGALMDAGNYEGLTRVSSVADWIAFSRQALAEPERFLERQQRFLGAQKMPTDPADVRRRFEHLLKAGIAGGRQGAPAEVQRPRERVLFVANNRLPTLQICFLRPLEKLVARREIAIRILTEQEMEQAAGTEGGGENTGARLVEERLESFRPTILVFCRYSGPHAERMLAWAKRAGIPSIFHIDDDLLNVPMTHGRAKFDYHNQPDRIATVRRLIAEADLVYASTPALAERLREEGRSQRITVAGINCAGEVLVPAELREVTTIGYMGGRDHEHDLETIAPVLAFILSARPQLSFEIFGPIPVPEALRPFKQRIRTHQGIKDYRSFIETFAGLSWDIGICPLAPTEFNRYKGNNKWVEYTAAGAAVVASRGPVYDACCSEGCGMLATTPAEWRAALEALVDDPAARFEQVSRAQERLRAAFSPAALRAQVLAVFEEAHGLKREANG